MISKRIVFILILIANAIIAQASYIKGVVKGSDGALLSFANVYIKNTTYGAASNLKGEYFLEIKPGEYTLVFSYLGYEKLEKTVRVPATGGVTVNAILKFEVHKLHEVKISADKEDPAREIMSKVRKKRKYYYNNLNSYSCRSYIKTSLEKESFKKDSATKLVLDSLKGREAKSIKELYEKQSLNLVESIIETSFKRPNRFKEVIIAHHDYVQKKPFYGQQVSASASYGPRDIVPRQKIESNPYILYEGISSCSFDFYENLIAFPAMTDKPLVSPISSSALLSYKYHFLESFYENNILIYKIEIIPLFKTESLFKGVLFIEDKTWRIKTADLYINKESMRFCNEFRIIQNYELINDSFNIPVRREMYYTIKEGRSTIFGNVRVDHQNYKLNKYFKPNYFNAEIKRYAVDAFDKDSAYWQLERPITLQKKEIAFIDKSDSLANYLTSDAYYHKIDSAFNRIHWWIWLTGVGHRNRAKGTEWRILGLPNQMNVFGIGGYRHTLPGYFNKEFKNDFLLENTFSIDYGFNNKDVKGKLGVGLSYIPEKFVRTFVEVGDFYERINDYASLEQVFSRSNYVRTRSFRIRQRMEIINGLFGELSFDYSDQDPLTDIQLSKWSKIVFGEMNDPTDFKRYIKSEIRLDLKYRIGQQYIIKRNKKIILGTDYPVLSLTYRKGIPGLFGSEVNFDYIELGAHNDMDLARMGSSRWEVNAGKFLNKANLRRLEYKYFRGSDRFLFSDPLTSFQLFEPDSIVYANNLYFKANYIHHFEGAILNKVPLINRLKLALAAGGGVLYSENDFSGKAHIEFFGGIERAIRIKKQLFRLGVYAVGRDNVFDTGNATIKFGIDFFDTFSNRWNY